MFPPFPQEKAYRLCKRLVSLLNDGTARILPTARQSKDRKNQGIMVGAMTCTDKGGTKEVNLVTISGISHTLEFQNNAEDFVYVPPVVAPECISRALEKNDERIHELTSLIQNAKAANGNGGCIQRLILERKALTTESLQNVYDTYSFRCADGSMKSLKSICAEKIKGALPPTGTGECCAPKLLHYAYGHGLVPTSLCEVFYEINSTNDNPCSPCSERCGIVLPAMLGLEILYRDEHIVIVNKQSGVLSVPGRGPNKQDCIANRLKRMFPNCIEQPAVHRLDMETSGILILAFTKEAHRHISRQFEDGLVKKQYTALVDGVLAKKGISPEGVSELYFRLDIDNRPHQIWDAVYGKKAVTQWKILNVEDYVAPDRTRRTVTRVLFTPHTGRTHQLRLASADNHGFGIPIVGDTIYGRCEHGERLMLHAHYIQFTHPATGERMELSCPPPF